MPLRLAAFFLAFASVLPAHAAPDDSVLLPRYHWLLTQADDAAGQPIPALLVRSDTPPQLDFDGNTLSVIHTCNLLRGDYSIKGEDIDVAPIGLTRMGCPDPALAGLDEAVIIRLTGRLHFAIDGQGDALRLKLTTARGDVLRLDARPTAQTRFGSEGETVFLEVAAKPMRCPYPKTPPASCLRVRDIRYDTHSLRDGVAGPWRPFDATIEGYTHDDGLRNVLRVKRYALAKTPVNGSSHAYVLDLIVESERIVP